MSNSATNCQISKFCIRYYNALGLYFGIHEHVRAGVLVCFPCDEVFNCQHDVPSFDNIHSTAEVISEIRYYHEW
jgi:hypothetical protein